MCSSYDYDAPISEAGWTTPKYHKLREFMTNYMAPGEVMADIPEAFPVIEIPEFELKETALLFDNLPEPKTSRDIQPMENSTRVGVASSTALRYRQ